MRIGRLGINAHKQKYMKSQWYYYWYPRRMTFKHNPAIYKWLFWVFGIHEKK